MRVATVPAGVARRANNEQCNFMYKDYGGISACVLYSGFALSAFGITT